MTTPEERAQWAKDALESLIWERRTDGVQGDRDRRILALCKDVEDLTAKVAEAEQERDAAREERTTSQYAQSRALRSKEAAEADLAEYRSTLREARENMWRADRTAREQKAKARDEHRLREQTAKARDEHRLREQAAKAEVQRLRDGITALADEYQQIVTDQYEEADWTTYNDFAKEVRAVGDEHAKHEKRIRALLAPQVQDKPEVEEGER